MSAFSPDPAAASLAEDFTGLTGSATKTLDAAAAEQPTAKNKNQCFVCDKPSATKCSKCKAVWYCSTACSTLDWKRGHKSFCAAADAANEGAHR